MQIFISDKQSDESKGVWRRFVAGFYCAARNQPNAGVKLICPPEFTSD